MNTAQQHPPTQTHTPQFLRKRKFLMILPVLAIPFLLSVFASLGGGKGKENKPQSPAKGFNSNLPAPNFGKQDTAQGKMAFYDRADADSLKKTAQIHQHLSAAPPSSISQADEMLQRLAQLKKKMAQTPITTASPRDIPQSMPQQHLDTPAAPDPQIEKLNGMLDKILRIQHPASPHEDTGFYADDEADSSDPSIRQPINAVVDEDQTLTAGATLKLRLTQNIDIDGRTIPENTLLYGKTSFDNDRMMLTIHSIACDQHIYPMSLEVYDLDGLPGIYMPTALNRDAAKQSLDQGISSMDLGSLNSSLGGQAANAGIATGKWLSGKKLRTIRVSIKAGYRVLLKNTDQRTN